MCAKVLKAFYEAVNHTNYKDHCNVNEETKTKEDNSYGQQLLQINVFDQIINSIFDQILDSVFCIPRSGLLREPGVVPQIELQTFPKLILATQANINILKC